MTTDLRQLNEEIATAENERNNTFFEKLLAENLVFRRADDTVVGKKEFLSKLKDQPPLRRSPENIMVRQAPDVDSQTLVTLIVCTVDEKSVKKWYRNIRLFTRTETGWELVFWYNYEITSL